MSLTPTRSISALSDDTKHKITKKFEDLLDWRTKNPCIRLPVQHAEYMTTAMVINTLNECTCTGFAKLNIDVPPDYVSLTTFREKPRRECLVIELLHCEVIADRNHSYQREEVASILLSFQPNETTTDLAYHEVDKLIHDTAIM